MDFSFTEEQQSLRDTLRAFLQDKYSFESRRATSMTVVGWRPEIWRALADLGIVGMTLPKRLGGLEFGPVEVMVAMEEMGRALMVEPFMEAVVVCGGVLARGGGKVADDALLKITAGELIIAYAWAEPGSRYDFSRVVTTAVKDGDGWLLNGHKSVVMAAPWASALLVTARTSNGVSLFMVDKSTAGISCSDYPTIDGRSASDVIFKDVKISAAALIGAEGKALELIDPVADAAIAALGAEAVGVMTKLHQDTIGYTKQRKQFGQPISNFQVLQHRMVDMYMEIEMTQSATYLATLKLSAPARERALAASTAKVTMSKACRFVGQNAVQLHGGMGMTDELAVGHYFKRATMIESDFGSADFHLARHVALSRVGL